MAKSIDEQAGEMAAYALKFLAPLPPKEREAKVAAFERAVRASLLEQAQVTHWQGCEEEHHACALAALKAARECLRRVDNALLLTFGQAENLGVYAILANAKVPE